MSDFGAAPAQSMGLQFWRVSQLWQTKIAEVLQTYNLTHTQFVILATVKWHEEQSRQPSQNDIAQMSKIDKMTLSKAVRKLEAAGLVRRTRSEADGRSVLLELSETSGDSLTAAIGDVERVDRDFFDRLSHGDSYDLLKILSLFGNST